MSKYSTYLFAMPSLTEGIASMIDFDDLLTRFNLTGDPDSVGLALDWQAVGDQLKDAMKLVATELLEC